MAQVASADVLKQLFPSSDDKFIEEVTEFTSQSSFINGGEEAWKLASTSFLDAHRHPFGLHKLLYSAAASAQSSNAPLPAYFPTMQRIKNSNAFWAATQLGLLSSMDARAADEPAEFGHEVWQLLYDFSVSQRELYWKFVVEEALKLKFDGAPSQMIKTAATSAAAADDVKSDDEFNTPEIVEVEYLPNASLNIVESCFHAEKLEKVAVYFQRDSSAEVESWTQKDLLLWTDRVASGVTKLGFERGSAIAICMPMTVETVAIYLGIVKAGMVVVSIADSFSAEEIRLRLEIAGAKAVFTQDFIFRDGGSKKIPLFERVRNACRSFEDVKLSIVLGGGAPDLSIHPDLANSFPECGEGSADSSFIAWNDFINTYSSNSFAAVICSPGDVTNLLFSSGTTSTPKAIPWTHSSPIKSAADGFFHQDIHSDDIVCWPTNIGWMMGPWLIYASLLNGAAIALFHGPPTCKEFAHFVQDARVTILGLVPSIVKAFKTKNMLDGINWDNIKLFSSTGETSNPDDYLWLMSRVSKYQAPVIEYCGGTETGGGYISGSVLQPQIPSTFSTFALGMSIELLDENGIPSSASSGEIALVPPSIGLSTVLMNADHFKVYYQGMRKGLRRHGDEMQRVEVSSASSGSTRVYYRALGRADDTMKLGGIKVSSVELEKICNKDDSVLETAAVAYNPASGGPSVLVMFTVMQSGCGNFSSEEAQREKEFELKKIFGSMIKKDLNPLFHVGDVVIVDSLPRTASNKVMRRILRDDYVKKFSSRLTS